jgi:hypothetical protein
MNNTEFINSKMIQGHRYAQRFETITESIGYQDDLDRSLTDFAKSHIVVSLTPYVHELPARVNVIVEYLADLTEERINRMCDDFLLTMASKDLHEKKEPRSKEELRKDPEFIQFKTWCEDLVQWEDKNDLAGKPIVVGGGKSMPPLLAELVEARDKEKVELYKKLFPDFAKRLHAAKVAYFAKKEESKTIVTGLTESD